jgi:3-oxoacyl-[acyl-carrier protein] reductase
MASKTLEGKVAVITGGTRGIGRAITETLSKQGASVVINYTSSADIAKTLVEEIKQNGGQAVSIQANIGEVDGAKKIVDAAVKAFGKIDILVNNAAIGEFKPVELSDADMYERHFNVNVRGPLLLVKESVPHLQDYGRIINISSVSARFGMPGSSVYAGTKGALESMSRAWASELGSKNITSNSINPGPVSTDLALNQPQELLDGLEQVINTRAALKRWGTVEDISNVVSFLASPQSQWITGDVLNANGGMLYI